MTDALVLSGGSIKGSWQAGAIAEVLASGITPSIVTGVSVGAINAAALTAWQPSDITDEDGWAETGADLAAFWETEITSPKLVARVRPWYELAYRVLFKKWAGVVDMAPLGKLLRETLTSFPTNVNGIDALVGCVNLRYGGLEYHPAHDLEAVMASAMEPVAMPTHILHGDHYVDGGIREIAPLGQAIKMGADRIVCIVCQPVGAGSWAGNPGDLLKLIGRCEGIVTNEIVANDIRRCEEINADINVGDGQEVPSIEGKKYIDLIVIRPLKPVPIALDSFTAADIAAAVEQGRQDARRVLAGRVANAAA